MTVTSLPPYSYRKNEGMWSKDLSSHSFEPILERAEGIYLFDTEGKRYIDVSGGPMACGTPHGDKRVNQAIADQLGIDICAAGLGVFEFLENHHRRSLTEHKPVTVAVKWPGGTGWRIVITGTCSTKYIKRPSSNLMQFLGPAA